MYRYCQMASVWEERFKEEAEKTIPLQEVRIGICFELFGQNWSILSTWTNLEDIQCIIK